MKPELCRFLQLLVAQRCSSFPGLACPGRKSEEKVKGTKKHVEGVGRFRQDAGLAEGFSGLWPGRGLGLPEVSKVDFRDFSFGRPKRSRAEGKVKLVRWPIFLEVYIRSGPLGGFDFSFGD